MFSSEPVKFLNLLHNLERQLIPSGNCLNKFLKISNVNPENGRDYINKLFNKPDRIVDIEFQTELKDDKTHYFAIVKFPSHSAARKTLEGFSKWEEHTVEWMSITGELMGDASITQPREDRPPAFCYAVFDPSQTGVINAVDEYYGNSNQLHTEFCEADGIQLLGVSFYNELQAEIEVGPSNRLFYY